MAEPENNTLPTIPLSDEDVVADFMEPMPSNPPTPGTLPASIWWDWPLGCGPFANVNNLDSIWIIEERLRLGSLLERKAFRAYGKNIGGPCKWHADARKRIRALANALRALGLTPRHSTGGSDAS